MGGHYNTDDVCVHNNNNNDNNNNNNSKISAVQTSLFLRYCSRFRPRPSHRAVGPPPPSPGLRSKHNITQLVP